MIWAWLNCIEQSSVCLYSVLPVLTKHKPRKLIGICFILQWCVSQPSFHNFDLITVTRKCDFLLVNFFCYCLYYVVLQFQGRGSGNLLSVDACLLISFFLFLNMHRRYCASPDALPRESHFVTELGPELNQRLLCQHWEINNAIFRSVNVHFIQQVGIRRAW